MECTAVFFDIDGTVLGWDKQVAADTAKYLEGRYGPGYMTPPPPGAQHNHPPWKLDFGPYGDA